MIPYTYLIGWSKLNIWYYGARYKKDCSPEDLWKTYFTSSKYVKRFRKENGDPDVIEVRKIFQTAEQTRLWEHKVLIRLDAPKKEKWLNESYSNAKFYNVTPASDETKRKQSESHKGKPVWNKGLKGLKGTPQTEEQKLRHSQFMKGKYVGEKNGFFGKQHTQEALEKNKLAHLGRKDSEETRLKKKLVATNKKHTEETKQKISLLKKQWHQDRKDKGIPHPMQKKVA